MILEEAKEILLNVIDDEFIVTYCIEIQKETDCSKNCENEDCFLQQAISIVLQEIEHLQKENRELKKEIEYIEEDRHNSAEAYKDMLKEQQRYYEERMEETY